MIKLIGAINSYWDLRDICRKYSGSCRNCPLGKEEDIMDTHCPRLTEPRSWSNEKNNRYGWKDWRIRMIIVDKNKAIMAGPDELIECEAMIFVEAVKRHFIKKHGENIGKEMFEILLECSVMSDEEAEKRARENKNKLSREENEMLNKFIHSMFS